MAGTAISVSLEHLSLWNFNLILLWAYCITVANHLRWLWNAALWRLKSMKHSKYYFNKMFRCRHVSVLVLFWARCLYGTLITMDKSLKECDANKFFQNNVVPVIAFCYLLLSFSNSVYWKWPFVVWIQNLNIISRKKRNWKHKAQKVGCFWVFLSLNYFLCTYYSCDSFLFNQLASGGLVLKLTVQKESFMYSSFIWWFWLKPFRVQW